MARRTLAPPSVRLPALACLLALAACQADDDGMSPAEASTGQPASTDDTGGPTTGPHDPTSSTSETGATDTTEPAADATSTTSTGDIDTSTGDISTTSTSDTSDTTATTADQTTGDLDDDCGAAELIHAPPAAEVDGLTAVPIDIFKNTAVVTIDAATKKVTAVATLEFRLGPVGGDPLFDLRQPVLTAELDGQSIPPQLLAAHDLGGGPGAELRVLAADLPPCSAHTLVLTYEIIKPNAPQSKAIVWEGDTTRLKWDSWNSDLWPGRYLESWFPANLIYDHFPFTLELTLLNSNFPHALATNGALEQLADHHWKISYPGQYTALSPMFVLVAESRVDRSTVELDLVDATSLTLELWKDKDVPTTLPEFQAILAPVLDDLVTTVGPYPHGDRFVAYAWNDPSRSMEYDGATTTTPESADHETFHSWWGRSVKPATQNDGWIDEAWDMHSVTVGFNETPIDMFADPVTLSPKNPWIRITPGESYTVGEQVFAGIGAMVGTPALRAAMTEFYTAHTHDQVTTAQLEQHLFCVLNNEAGVRAVFHRFVYGYDGEPAPVPPDFCD